MPPKKSTSTQRAATKKRSIGSTLIAGLSILVVAAASAAQYSNYAYKNYTFGCEISLACST